MNYLGTQLSAWMHAPLAKALGWSLIHFVWQGVVLALLLAALLSMARRSSARLRYGLACVTLAAMPVAVAITLALSCGTPTPIALPAHVDVTDAGPLDHIAVTPAAGPGLKALLPWVPIFWMAGVLIFYARTLGGWILTHRLQTAGVSPAGDLWQARFDALCHRLRLSRPVVLLESCLVDGPVLMGFLRPVVLMPVGIFAGLSTDQVECILIHELAHISRRDYVVNLLQSLVEGLLFYHPAVWWVSAQIRAERENCCDDVVVNVKGDARGYAAALATLERNRWPAGEPALAATGGSLMKRIRRLLQEPERRRTGAAPVVVGLLLISVGVALASWQPQPPPTPQLPVATQKAAAPEPTAVTKEPGDDPDQTGDRIVGGCVVLSSDREIAYVLEKEIALGKQLAQEVERHAKLIDDPVIAEYVNRVGQNLVRNSDVKVPFTIKVLDTKDNACALPGGFFFVNSGHNLKAESEAAQMVPADRSKPPVKLVAQATPLQAPVQDPVPTVARPMSDRQKQKNEEKLRKELETPYRKWLNEDVAYIILDEERSAFKALQTDEEREHFIEQFWLRRDPTPGTFENEFREEHYRRIAYANEHFSSFVAGWKTDRGRIYIQYGPPDEIESHPKGGSYQRPPEEGGGTIDTVPFEQWRYRLIQGVGTNVIIEFVDPLKNGEYRMTSDPSEKDALLNTQRQPAKADGPLATIQVMSTPAANGQKAVLISFPLQSYGDHKVNVLASIRTSARRAVQNFSETISGTAQIYQHFVSLASGSYILNVIIKDNTTGKSVTDERNFDVQ